jgi:cation:H+ antiporter
MRTPLAIALAFLSAVPSAAMHFGLFHPSVEIETLLNGLGIVGAAFAMAWAAEASERDIPRALALTVVALLAVLPEYAVDIIFAVKAGQDPAFAPYAAANMTGSNRLLVGLGWSTVSVLAWVSRRERVINLDHSARLPLFFLGVATLYSFSLPFRSSISLVDSVVLIGLFGVYAVFAAREDTEEPDLVGPAASIGALPTLQRRLSILGLFAFAAAVIATSAEPFAEGLVHTGQKLGIDEFLLVQWLAPLASEAPEFLVAALLALRGKTAAAVALLLSAKVNQWTLLVGSLPIAYSFGAGAPAALPLDQRQVAEVLLTASQSLFGVAVLASLSLSLLEAGLLAGLFTAQLVAGGVVRAGLHDAAGGEAELLIFSLIYILLSLLFMFQARSTLATLWQSITTKSVKRRIASSHDLL